MKTSACIFTIAALAAPLASAFSVTNCNTGQYTNYGEAGNGKCKNFVTGNKATYDSNKGLQLHIYSATDCQGSVYTITSQNACVDIPFNGLSVLAD